MPPTNPFSNQVEAGPTLKMSHLTEGSWKIGCITVTGFVFWIPCDLGSLLQW